MQRRRRRVPSRPNGRRDQPRAGATTESLGAWRGLRLALPLSLALAAVLLLLVCWLLALAGAASWP